MKKIITPEHDLELARWIAHLKNAGFEYEEVRNDKGQVSLLVDESVVITTAPQVQNIVKPTLQNKFIDSVKTYWQQVPANYKITIIIAPLLLLFAYIFTQQSNDATPIKEATESTEVFSANSEEEVKISPEERARLDSLAEVKTTEELLKRLETEADSAIKFNGQQFRGSPTNLALEVFVFGEWVKLIRKGEYHTDPKIAAAAKKLKKAVIAAQVREFPKMRKDFAKVLAERLWEDNIKVSIKGKTSTTLQYMGYVFANNASIKNMQESMPEVLNSLIFKRINYFWSEYIDEYTYYDMDTPKDSELVIE